MKTLYIERSTGESRRGDWVEALDLEGVERIVVGTGPGSFAGIRSALGFAQGYALGRPCEVLGLPSGCAVAAQLYESRFADDSRNVRLAVIGDSRRGMIWVALFNGYSLEKEVFQVKNEDLLGSVPNDYLVTTPDEQRIGLRLGELFGERYLGGATPTAAGLKAFAEKNPSALVREPLPIYLNPAVRD